MEYLPNTETLTHLLDQYGILVLFVLLALGIIALPVPEETLLVLTGILISNDKLALFPAFFSVLLGSVCGISVSYILGRTAGNFIIHKYGSWVGITEKKLEQAHGWFERFGTWSLFIGYFIPGVRHFTGFSAGTTYLDYRHFALFAYSGALVWVSTFLSIGYFFGDFGLSLLEKIEFGADDIIVAILLILSGFLIWKLRKAD